MNEQYSDGAGKSKSSTRLKNYILLGEVASIIILVAVMVFFSNKNTNNFKAADSSQVQTAIQNRNNPAQIAPASLEQLKPVTKDDHIRGSFDAPVKIVEYSDPECPFCKRFHTVMQQIMAEYGQSGKVAWIYRHYPIPQLHSKAANEAAAIECANELGGNDKFWAYADRLYEVTPSNNGLAPEALNTIAQYVGLDVEKFSVCLASGKYAQHIESDSQNGVATGGNGTPWSIVVAKNGKKYEISGAQAYDSVKQIIELALQEK